MRFSVVGVLLTGYVLLPCLGITGTCLFAATLVTVSALSAGQFLFASKSLVLIITALAVNSLEISSELIFDKSNGYHRISIRQPDDDPTKRYVYLDSTLEGGVQIGSPIPVLSYQKEIKRIASKLPRLSRAYFLGGGSFSMPRYLKHLYPKLEVEVSEIDPDLENAAKEYLELSNEVSVNIGDGKQVLKSLSGSFDLIVNDAFQGISHIPFHLLTTEFNQQAYSKLSDQGFYIVNVHAYHSDSSLFSSIISTLRKSFPYVSVHTFSSPKKNKKASNTWVIASKSKISLGSPAHTHPGYNPQKGLILTNNFAPIEYLISKSLL